jgi:hypothetical protein
MTPHGRADLADCAEAAMANPAGESTTRFGSASSRDRAEAAGRGRDHDAFESVAGDRRCPEKSYFSD